MLNPYYFKPVDNLDEFFGRQALMQEVLASADNWGIIGERRIGKTSLLRSFSDLINATEYHDKFQPIYIDLQYALGDDLQHWFIKYFLTHLGIPTIKKQARALRDPEDLYNLFEDTLANFEKNKTLLICIDELDALRNTQEPKLVNFIRGLAKEQHIQIVGGAFRNLKHISEGFEASPFFNVFRQERLGNLDHASTEQVITFDGTLKARFSSALIDQIYDFSGGNPYLTKLLCYFVWNSTKDETRILDTELMDQVYQNVNFLQMLEDYCRYAWNHLMDVERYMLLQKKPYLSLKEKGYQHDDTTIGAMRWWIENNYQSLLNEFEQKGDHELAPLKDRLEAIGEHYVKVPKEAPIIYEISVIHNDGLLLQHYPEQKSDKDTDIIASMFDAVKDFVKFSFGEHEGSLDGLEFGKFKIIVENGSYLYCFIIASRNVTDDFRLHVRSIISTVEKKYKSTFEDWWGLVTDDILNACDDIISTLV